MDIYRSLASALEKTVWPMRYELACLWRSGQWIVDSGSGEVENGWKQTWRSLEERKMERVGNLPRRRF